MALLIKNNLLLKAPKNSYNHTILGVINMNVIANVILVFIIYSRLPKIYNLTQAYS